MSSDDFCEARFCRYMVALFFLFFVCVTLISLNLYWDALNNNLSKNERVYSEIARVVSEGGMPYRDTWDHKPPMLYFLLAIFVRLFGNSALSIHLAGVILGFLFASISALFVSKLTHSDKAAVIAFLAAIFYGALWAEKETSPDSLMVVLGTASFYLAYTGRDSQKKTSLSGLIFAGAFFSKQPILTQLPALLIFSFWLAAPNRKWRNISSLMIGLLTGILLMVAWVMINGIGEAFWYQAFETNFLYSLNQGNNWHFQVSTIDIFRENFLPQTLPYLLPLIAFAVPSAALALKHVRPLAMWVLFWLLMSCAGAIIGRAMSPSYFSQTLPPLITINAIAVPYYSGLNKCWQSGVLISLTLLVVGLHHNDFKLPSFHQLNNEARSLSPLIDFIEENTSKDQCLWTWGEFEGHINYYSERRSCTRQLQSMPMMVPDAFNVSRNRNEYMGDLMASTPALHVRSEVWGYFPELQKYADRYLGPAIFNFGGLTIFQINRSMWHPHYANYANQIELMGVDLYSTEIVPGQNFRISLTWRVLNPVKRQYGLFVHLLAKDQQLLFAQYDGLPASDRPTETWMNIDEIILSDVLTLAIPDELPPGEYYLVSGFYDFETISRLEVFDHSGQFRGYYEVLANLRVAK